MKPPLFWRGVNALRRWCEREWPEGSWRQQTASAWTAPKQPLRFPGVLNLRVVRSRRRVA